MFSWEINCLVHRLFFYALPKNISLILHQQECRWVTNNQANRGGNSQSPAGCWETFPRTSGQKILYRTQWRKIRWWDTKHDENYCRLSKIYIQPTFQSIGNHSIIGLFNKKFAEFSWAGLCLIMLLWNRTNQKLEERMNSSALFTVFIKTIIFGFER